MKIFFKHFLLFLVFLSIGLLSEVSAQCSVNAGGNATICGTSYTLQGSATGSPSGNPTWTLVSKPLGAPDPVISNINSYTPNVTGMTYPGNYIFQITQACSSGTINSQVRITAPGDASTFTAGPDITNIPATTGIATLNATIPAGYTASWTYYNLNSYEFNTSVVTTNATMTGTTTATPTLTLTKKADHDIDPVYRATLRITSVNNPSCWYEDSTIVRFIPNPNVSYPSIYALCGSPSTDPNSRYFYDPNSTSPRFSDNTTNASASTTFGTTITMNLISQPAGGNLTYARMMNGRIIFGAGFNQTIGDYVFTLTIRNSDGSTYTTPNLTFRYNGSQPGPINFVDPAYPQQTMEYASAGSGGAVYCNMSAQTTPITFYFKINPADPANLTASVTNSGITPPGGAPSLSAVTGAGSMNRSVTVTPPTGGWRVGTYKFNVSVSNGTCGSSRPYYIHISDSSRPNVTVPNTTVCYPGSGSVTTTIPLPAIYKGVVNTSYLQDYLGYYDITQISGPTTATFDPTALRTLTNTSTNIGNLRAGTYVFHIKARGNNTNVAAILDKEYACSGTSMESDFTIYVSTQVNANAGSDQTVVGNTQTTLNGNNPGAISNGTWTLVSKPSGAADPVIVTPSAYNTNVTGLNTAGTYTFRWTITTGTCSSVDDVDVIIPGSCVNNAPTIFYNADNAGNTYGNTGGTGNLLPFVTASNIAGGTYYKTTGTETLNGVRPKSGSTLFSMSGITNAVQASKYYSFNITTAANAPILHFNRFTAIAMDVDLVLSPGGMPNVSYNLRVAIVDPDTGSEINLGNVYINTVSGVNLPVSYKLKPGKTYMVKLYPWNTNGRTITYLDNPRLYFSPVPVVSNADLCLTNLSGTVGTALATYVSSTVPAGMQVRWLQNGFDVTGNPITEGIYSPVYYNTAGSCYAETLGDPITVTNNCAVPFTCDTKYYLTQYGSAATDKTILYTLDNTTNPFTKTIIGESPAGMKVNAIGYNTVDNFIYGMRTDASNATHMVKIDANGVFTDLGAVNNLPAGGFNSGGFDNAGNYYIISFDTSNFYRINITTNTAILVPLSRVLKVNDIAFDPTTNLFYGYEQSAGQLVSISTSGVVNNVGTPSTLGNVYMGAMYSDSNGDIFGNEDDGSGFYQFNKTTGQVVKISESISAFGNDGANCQTAVIKFPADLSITKTDNTAYYIPGRPTVYTIVVRNNNGPYGVLGATVSDPLPAGISAADVSYSVPVLTGGATTSITGPQTGALNDVVGLPVGATITYTVTVNVPSTFTGNLINTVTVTPPANSTDPDNSNNTATDTDINGVCYKPGVAGTALDTKVGITSLNRAGADNADNWPMVRKGGHIALESKTKAFVPNRVAFSDADNNVATPDVPVGIPASNFVEGMMVYDTTNKCLKIYTWKEGDTGMAWHCITTPSCPDNYN